MLKLSNLIYFKNRLVAIPFFRHDLNNEVYGLDGKNLVKPSFMDRDGGRNELEKLHRKKTENQARLQVSVLDIDDNESITKEYYCGAVFDMQSREKRAKNICPNFQTIGKNALYPALSGIFKFFKILSHFS